MNDDLIRRSDAIEVARHAAMEVITADGRQMLIESIPSADKWIPCSERMPMYDVDVLVYRPTMGMKIIVDHYCGYYGEDIDTLDEWYEGWAISRENPVTAWMPLPEPWKGADDERNIQI